MNETISETKERYKQYALSNLVESPEYYAYKVANLRSTDGTFSTYKESVLEVFMSETLNQFSSCSHEDFTYKMFCNLREIYYLFADFEKLEIEKLKAEHKALLEKVKQLEKALSK